jgi:hypothetical protein
MGSINSARMISLGGLPIEAEFTADRSASKDVWEQIEKGKSKPSGVSKEYPLYPQGLIAVSV